MPDSLQDEAVAVLQRLLRINTVNPPGNERPAQEYLAGLLSAAGLETTLLGPDPERPNLVARLRGHAPGPVLGLLSHVDTVIADPAGWRHDPWSGAPECVAYGFFPHLHMTLDQVGALVHGRDERIDVRDLALAVDCYRSVATELLG